MGRSRLIKNADVHSSAAIALSKLATGALPTAITVASANISGDIARTHLPAVAMAFTFTPAAKGTNNIAASLAGNSETHPFTISASPDVPRNLRVIFAADWDGGNVSVIGTDAFDAAVTETFTGASDVTRVGTKIFKTVTSAAKTAVGAAAAGATIGTGDMIGCTTALTSAFGMLTVDGTAEAVTVETTYHSFTPTTAPDGARVFVLIANT